MWASKLPFVEFGINTTVNVSMGKYPYELVIRLYLQLPVDIILGIDKRLNPQSSEFI